MKKKNKDKNKSNDLEERQRRKKKKSFIIDIIFIILSLLSSSYLISSLLLLGNIEKLLYVLIAFICILNVIMIINLFRRNKKKKRVKKSIKRFFLTLLIIVYLIIGYVIKYTINSLDSMNKDYLTYSTALVTLKTNPINDAKDINGSIIATGNDKNDTQLYVLPWKIINKYGLDKNNKIVEYDDEASLITALYEGEVEYIFIQANYASVYANYEEYATLEEDTKIIDSDTKEEAKEDLGLQGSSKDLTEPVTILLLGVDSKANGIKNADSFNGDAMILVTFNPKTLKATMLSIPRDSYVPISCFPNKTENKITHAAARGTKCAINTIQDYFDVDIDYYVKINFTGLVDLVDTLGGIDVDVPFALCEQNSKRQWGKNTVYVEEGLQHLNGEQALALSRNRKKNTKNHIACGEKYLTGTRNDFVRGQNQQLVLEGMLDKFKEIKDFQTVKDILNAISNNIDTNMTVDTILSFYNVGKDILNTSRDENGDLITIQKLYLAGADQKIYDERTKLVLYNYIPNQESKEEIVKAMKENLGLITPSKKVTTFSYSIEKYYEPNVIGRYPKTSTKLYTLIPNFKTYTRAKAQQWATSNGFTIIFNEIKSTAYADGTIIEQSYPERKRVDLCSPKTITLKIVNNKTVNQPTPDNNNDDESSNDTDDENDSDDDNSKEDTNNNDSENNGSKDDSSENDDSKDDKEEEDTSGELSP